MKVEEITDQATWDAVVNAHCGHPLQLWGWGELKAKHRWQVKRYTVKNEAGQVGGAQVQVRSLPWPFRKMFYIARGPFMKDSEHSSAVLTALSKHLKRQGSAVVLTVEPDFEQLSMPPKFKPSSNTVLMSKTLILDLRQSQEQLLEGMAKKTRQYIRKSSKQGIEIAITEEEEEIKDTLAVYHLTAERAGFGLHENQYYLDIAKKLGQNSKVFIAKDHEQVVAFLWLAVSKETAFELYGGMNELGQKLRANYALKWQAITWAKEQGIKRYDLNGLLNEGVSHFKEGFASHRNELIGTYDYPLNWSYGLWAKLLPRAKKFLQKSKVLLKSHR